MTAPAPPRLGPTGDSARAPDAEGMLPRGTPPGGTPLRDTDPEFDRLPAVARRLGRGEWGALAGVWGLLALSALDGDVRALRQVGAPGAPAPYWQVALAAWLGTALWLAAAPWAFAALDRLPVLRGVWVRHLALRALLAVGATAAHSAAARGLVDLAGARLGLDAAVVASARAQWHAPLGGSFDGFLALLLAHVVLQRVHRSRYRQHRAAALEASLARARLDALSTKLEPHFLFNTLNGIVSLVRGDPARAEAMLIKLSDLLRLALDESSAGEVPLRAELARLALYVDLQRMRFGPRLTLRWDLADDALDALVPGMLLQPLVENAFTHGLEPARGPATLTITVRTAGDRLQLSVCDSGVGLAPDAAARERTGVRSTRARLAAHYGADFRFALGAPAGAGGTLATVDIPRRAEPRRAGDGAADPTVGGTARATPRAGVVLGRPA
jgi:signal transduction histidine kinase